MIRQHEDATFIVVMDLPNAQAGHMPTRFYRALKKLQDVERLQKSVYLATGVSNMKELVRLGRACGFEVQAFQVIKNDSIMRSRQV
jgi:hypothetical protein